LILEITHITPIDVRTFLDERVIMSVMPVFRSKDQFCGFFQIQVHIRADFPLDEFRQSFPGFRRVTIGEQPYQRITAFVGVVFVVINRIADGVPPAQNQILIKRVPLAVHHQFFRYRKQNTVIFNTFPPIGTPLVFGITITIGINLQIRRQSVSHRKGIIKDVIVCGCPLPHIAFLFSRRGTETRSHVGRQRDTKRFVVRFSSEQFEASKSDQGIAGLCR